MSELGLAIIGAMVRTTVVGLFAMALVDWRARRRGPESGAMAASAGLVGLVLTAGLSFMPWPAGWTVHYLTGPSPDPSSAEKTQAQRPVLARALTRAASAAHAVANHESMSLRAISQKGGEVHRSDDLARLIPAGVAPSAPAAVAVASEPARAPVISIWPLCLLGFLCLGWGWGITRLAVGILGWRRCVANSQAVADQRLLRMVAQLLESLGQRSRTVGLRESSAWGLPATVGVFRPCILLPLDWRDWTDEECRVVLAHELAHIRGGDFAKRLAGQVCTLLHFYHPIAHWLLVRMKFEQELAADAWGITLTGGRATYVTALARIALREDAARGRELDRSLMALDGFFLRRIEMLTSERVLGWARERNSWRTRWTTLGLLSVAAVLATAVRPSVAPAGDASLHAVREIPSDPRVPTRKPFDLSRVPADAVGVVAIRPSLVLASDAIQPLLTLLQMDEGYKKALTALAGMGLGPESIEQMIYVQFKVDLDAVVKDPMSIALKGALIINSSSSINSKAATAEFKEVLEKYHLVVVSADDRTAIIGTEAAVSRMVKPPAAGIAAGAKPAWAEAWAGVERNQVAMAFDARYARSMIEPIVMSDQMEMRLFASPVAPIWEVAKSMSVGLDLVGDDVEIVSLNISGTELAAERTCETVQALLTLSRNAASSMSRQLRQWVLLNQSGMDALLIGKLGDLCATQILAKTGVQRNGNAVRFTSKIDLDTLLILTQLH